MDCRQIASSPSGRSNIAMRPLILSQPRTALLLNVFKHFTSTYLHTKEIHSLVASYDTEVRKTVLTSYFLALAALRDNKVNAIPTSARSALLTAVAAKKASVFALFGGQGTNESLYDIYKPFVSEFLATVTNGNALLHYTFGLDVLSWLSGTSPRPSTTYLASVPISFPLIGLTQPIQYLAACNVAGMSPGQYRDTISGATGQSQGIVSAVAIAASGTYQSFCANAVKAVKWLFFRGLRGQQAFPIVALEPGIVQDSIEGGEGVPMPMLSVTGLQLDELAVYIKKTNAHLAENAQLSVSLHNGPHAFVVPGPARSLFGLVTHLRKIRAPSGVDQDAKLIEDLGGEELWKTGDLKIPVFNTKDGTDLRQLSTSITKSLCEQVFTKPVHWTAATNFPENATHAVDFGPSGLSGIGPLTAKNLDGRGVRVIVVGDRTKGDPELYNAQNVRYEESWNKFAPGLVKTSDGTMYLDTRFSRLLGKPPIMVAGMTPSTVQTGFVSAVLNAGYHVELAGGGHYNATALHTKVVEIQSKIPAGIGITLNALYINQRQFGFQLPLWQEMRKEGLPIEGFCVAAGIPSPEKAAEIIEGLKSAGIRHVAFKPGSVEGIRQVVNIAGANPGFPIILRWTGGRAGDHHSYEDFHWPVLQTYHAIRQQANISLVGGSGFGVAEDVWPYFSGEWSAKYDMQPMPFDSFLFASRVMVAKEAHTSPSVKDLIVAAAGVEEAECEGTYVKPTGGILTVKSELGGPIHKVATRGVKLWKEFDDTVFKLPKEKRVAWLVEHREEVIGKLNKDFSKPWFEWKDGSVANELNDMTYEETVLRMVQLMFVAHEKRWVDILLGNLTGDWLRRIEERFAGAYPIATRQLLASEDSAFFLAIAQCLGQKPVPFIPVLDASFEVWFKKDSLWAAEDIEAVFDQDPQRVCILQGPMAVKHSKVKDEPIKDLLGNINSALIQRLLEFRYAGDESKAPTVDYLSAKPAALPAVANVERSETNGEVVYQFGTALPDTSAWLDTLAGPHLN
ncbi:fatty acid synthase [Mycena sanguinolenta]|nr:fatty acid synthase [Mycena sanguinolenta]